MQLNYKTLQIVLFLDYNPLQAKALLIPAVIILALLISAIIILASFILATLFSLLNHSMSPHFYKSSHVL